MNLELLIAGLLILLLGGAWILRPLLAGWGEPDHSRSDSLSRLQEDVQRLAAAVRDLDMDYDMGKVGQADYIMQRKLLIGRGVSATLHMQHLEQSLDQEIESLVAQVRGNG